MSVNYANENSFKLYVDYLAIKKHFTTKNYDYHKYNGKVKASFEKFQTRNDAFFFYKLSQKRNSHELLLSNLVNNPNMWIREIIDDSGNETYLKWKKYMDAISYNFSNELGLLDDNYKSNFIARHGQHPKLMEMLLQRKLSFEAFTILSNISNIFDYWETSINDPVIATDIIFRAKKYYSFLDIDQKKFSEIIKNKFF